MSLEERDAIVAMLAGRRPARDLAARRAGLDAMLAGLWGAEVPPPVSLMPGLEGRWAPGPAAAGRPILVWLHGGAFQLGSSAGWWPLAQAIARRSGVAVLVPDYPLAPEHRFPHALERLGALLAQLRRRHGAIALGGDSAGGNLALACAQRLSPGAAPLAGLWLLSAYLDLTHRGASIASRRGRDRFVDPDDGTRHAYAGDAPLDDPAVSPLLGSLEELPPALIQVGTEEVLFDDSRRLAEALAAAGAQPVFQAWQGMMHVWPLFAPRLEEGRWALAQGADWLAQLFQA